MVTKLTADQQRRVGDIQQFQKVVEHVAKLVAELNSNRAAKATFIDNICESIARQLSQMRQRALTSGRSEEHTSELQSLAYLVCRLLLEKKKKYQQYSSTIHRQ